jgi:hypothetical protein
LDTALGRTGQLAGGELARGIFLPALTPWSSQKEEKAMERLFSIGNWRRFAVIIAALGMLMINACGNYYRVKDPATGNTYYTTQIDRQQSGSVRFVDAKAGGVVTLQTSVVEKIDSDEFEANAKKK